MPGHSHRFFDERLAKALSHRLRVQILQRLEEAGEASPNALAQALGEPVGNISYHVRILRDLDCVELVRTETRRGALAHFYRATVSPWLDDEQWAGLSAGMRRETLSRTLSEIIEQAAAAGREGGFDGPEAPRQSRRARARCARPGRAHRAARRDTRSHPPHRDEEHSRSGEGRTSNADDDRDRGRRRAPAP
jgi:DNA-binding transcriptional ArsR family regulator